MDDRRTYRPLPELVDSGRKRVHWKVIDAADRTASNRGSTNKRAREMLTPLGAEGIGISRHEMAHAKLSPVNPPETDFDPGIVQAIEDARINSVLTGIGTPCFHDALDDERVAALFAEDLKYTPTGAITRAFASIGTDGAGGAREHLERLPAPLTRFALEWFDRIESLFDYSDREKPLQFKVVMAESEAYAAALADLLGREEKPEPGEGKPGESEPGEGAPSDGPAGIGAEGEGKEGEGEPGEGEPGEGKPGEGAATGAPGAPGAPGAGDESGGGSHAAPAAPADRPAPDPMRVDAMRKLAKGGKASFRKDALTSPTTMSYSDKREERDARRERLEEKRSDARHRDYAAEFKAASRDRARRSEERTMSAAHVTPYGNGGIEDSGIMEICTPRLNIPQAAVAGMTARRPRCNVEGTMVRRVDRLLIDGAIFAKRTTAPGFIVMIDQSGSMSLDAPTIEAACLAAGGMSLIATYSGDPSTDVGQLRIVANGAYRGGRAVLHPFSGGNVVDVPALGWLAKQPGEKVWVCDNGLTGKGDYFYNTVTAECMRIRRATPIVRIGNVRHLARYLTARSKRTVPAALRSMLWTPKGGYSAERGLFPSE